MNIYFISPSDKELDDAFNYYEEQLQGLGYQFLEHIENTIALIQKAPLAWRKISTNTRRINVKQFPYLILYIFENDTIFVTCIAHAHRDPKYYLSRAK